MATYEESKTNLLNSLNETSKLIKHVFETKNSINQFTIVGQGQESILNQNEEKQLDEYLTAYSKYADKLSKNSFEIAIVGLEKAGKSTFINALIENDILPSAPERCTYTTTKLVASESGEDSAEIEFYSEEEFNQIFTALFKEAFPDYEGEVHFREITEQKITELDAQSQSIDASMIADLKEIVKYRDSLILTAERKYFAVDKLNTDEFKDYIRGEKIGNTKNVNTAKPRSVKNIEIRSSKVASFKQAGSALSPVIYDVPGFDSPTKIHRKQTVERLSKADAIILVTNVGRNPSLQGTILDVLKEIDSDNIPYKDKLFAFGNQLDTANSREIADGNEKIYRSALSGLAENKRIFVGSALKHLSDKGLTKETGHHTFDFIANVEEFRAELIHYLQTERFEILKKNITAYLAKGEECLNQIKIRLQKEVGNLELDPESRRFDIIDSTQDTIIDSFNKNLKELSNNYIKAQNDKVLSQKLETEINQFNCFTPISLETLRESNGGASITGVTDKTEVNLRAREIKLKEILERFRQAVQAFDLSNANQLHQDTVNTFIESMPLSSADKKLVRLKIEERFNQKVSELIDLQSGKFEFLISRVSRPLFDIFRFPLSNDINSSRANQFETTRKDFLYLSTFYGDSELGKNNDSALTYLLLAQKKSTQIDITIDKVAELVKHLVDEHFHVEKIKTTVNTLADVTTEAFGVLKKWRPFGKNEEDEISPVNNLEPEIIKPKIEEDKMTWFDFLFRPDRIGKIIEPTVIKLAKASTTEEEVLAEINTDIENIQNIFFNAVIPAINLEITSYIHNDTQITKLLEFVNQRKLNAFIRKEIVPIVAEQRFKGIDNEIEVIKLKQDLIKILP